MDELEPENTRVDLPIIPGTEDLTDRFTDSFTDSEDDILELHRSRFRPPAQIEYLVNDENTLQRLYGSPVLPWETDLSTIESIQQQVVHPPINPLAKFQSRTLHPTYAPKPPPRTIPLPGRPTIRRFRGLVPTLPPKPKDRNLRPIIPTRKPTVTASSPTKTERISLPMRPRTEKKFNESINRLPEPPVRQRKRYIPIPPKPRSPPVPKPTATRKPRSPPVPKPTAPKPTATRRPRSPPVPKPTTTRRPRVPPVPKPTATRRPRSPPVPKPTATRKPRSPPVPKPTTTRRPRAPPVPKPAAPKSRVLAAPKSRVLAAPKSRVPAAPKPTATRKPRVPTATRNPKVPTAPKPRVPTPTRKPRVPTAPKIPPIPPTHGTPKNQKIKVVTPKLVTRDPDVTIGRQVSGYTTIIKTNLRPIYPNRRGELAPPDQTPGPIGKIVLPQFNTLIQPPPGIIKRPAPFPEMERPGTYVLTPGTDEYKINILNEIDPELLNPERIGKHKRGYSRNALIDFVRRLGLTPSGKNKASLIAEIQKMRQDMGLV